MVRHLLRRCVAAAAVVTLVVWLPGLAACTHDPYGVEVLVEADFWLSHPVLLDNGSAYYLHYSAENSGLPDDLMRTDGRGDPVVVDLPSLGVDSCDIGDVTSLSRLPDGRLGVVAECGEPASETTSFALDSRGVLARLGAAHGGREVVWRPGLQSAWVEFVGTGCHSMGLMTAVALTEFPTYSPRDLLPWNLDSGLRNPGACVVDGRAGYIGQAGAGLVYFLASPASRGVAPGPADDRRRSIPWNLYLLDVDAGTVRTIAGDFVEPTGLAVSADGRRVLVSGDRLGTRALWSVDVRSGDCVALAEGNFAYVNAASSGRVVVAQRRVEGDDWTHPSEQIVRIAPARRSP